MKVFTALLAGVMTASFLSTPAIAQLSFPQRVGQNMCWYMSKGWDALRAMQMAINPAMLINEQKGTIPGYVTQNAMYITRDIKSYQGRQKELMRDIAPTALTLCGGRMSPNEYKVFQMFERGEQP